MRQERKIVEHVRRQLESRYQQESLPLDQMHYGVLPEDNLDQVIQLQGFSEGILAEREEVLTPEEREQVYDFILLLVTKAKSVEKALEAM